MNIELWPETAQILQEKLASGQYTSPQELLDQALREFLHFEVQDGQAEEDLPPLLAEGIAQIEGGLAIPYDSERVWHRAMQIRTEKSR